MWGSEEVSESVWGEWEESEEVFWNVGSTPIEGGCHPS